MKRIDNSARNELICNLYKAGHSCQAIGKMVDLDPTQIGNILHANNIEMRPAHAYKKANKVALVPEKRYVFPKIRKVDKKLLVQKRSEGTSVTQLAELFNCTKETISRHLHDLGLGDWTWVKPDEVAQMMTLRENGLTNAEIARRVGRCYESVVKHIGRQPDEITEASIRFRSELCSIKAKRRTSAKSALMRKAAEEAAAEAARLEALRIAEEQRVKWENEVREVYTILRIPSENVHIENAQEGIDLIASLQNHLNNRPTAVA